MTEKGSCESWALNPDTRTHEVKDSFKYFTAWTRRAARLQILPDIK